MKCIKIKQKLDTIYGTKCKYFAYLAISIDPGHIDVNVHPSKKEVTFMYEGEIIKQIGDVLEEQMRACYSSNTLQMVQATITCRPVDPDRSEGPFSECKLQPKKKVRIADNMHTEDIPNADRLNVVEVTEEDKPDRAPAVPAENATATPTEPAAPTKQEEVEKLLNDSYPLDVVPPSSPWYRVTSSAPSRRNSTTTRSKMRIYTWQN